MASPPPFIDASAERAYIQNRAAQLGLDPEAVLAVAAHEGVTLPGEVGDQGTSFGPLQLHEGGALPSTVWNQGAAYAQAWADSPQGIDYALQGMAKVAKGLSGEQAVTAIVYQFEHPLQPAPEAAAAYKTYQQGGGPKLSGGGSVLGSIPSIGSIIGDIPIQIAPGISGPTIGGITGGATSIWDALTTPEKFFKFLTSWRFAEVAGGFLLLLLGLWLVARQFGVAPSAGGAAGTVARVASRVPA